MIEREVWLKAKDPTNALGVTRILPQHSGRLESSVRVRVFTLNARCSDVIPSGRLGSLVCAECLRVKSRRSDVILSDGW